MLNSGYILKVEFAGLVNELELKYERKETSDLGHDFGLSKWNNRH